MREADRRTISDGTPESVLVERAGRAVARAAVRMLGGTYGRRAVVVCGRGNNGADGIVAARRLREVGVGVDVFPVEPGLGAREFERALARSDLAIDAMFGTGFRGVLEGDAARTAAAFVTTALPTLAIDIPSGVDGLTGEVRGGAVRAHETVCFAALKPGLLFEPGRTHAGRVRSVDIGIDASGVSSGSTRLDVLECTDLVLPVRAGDGH